MSVETRESAPRCPLCTGSGRYWHAEPYRAGYARTCPRCKGTGRLEGAAEPHTAPSRVPRWSEAYDEQRAALRAHSDRENE